MSNETGMKNASILHRGMQDFVRGTIVSVLSGSVSTSRIHHGADFRIMQEQYIALRKWRDLFELRGHSCAAQPACFIQEKF